MVASVAIEPFAFAEATSLAVVVASSWAVVIASSLVAATSLVEMA